jgi:hypothetical protein
MRIDLDNIKIKVFLKILVTGDFSYYSSKEKEQIKLSEVWEDLKDEYELVCDDKKKNKQISISSRIEALLCKYKAISIACHVLRFTYSEQAISILKDHYLKIDRDNYNDSIDKIENDSKSILIQIEKLKSELPTEDDQETTSKSNQSIDEIILGYCAFVGVTLRPNDATVMEFLGLKKLFESKLSELEKKKDVR